MQYTLADNPHVAQGVSEMPDLAAELETEKTDRALLARHTFDNLPPQAQLDLWHAATKSVEVGIALQNGHWSAVVETLQKLGDQEGYETWKSLAAVVDRYTPHGLEG